MAKYLRFNLLPYSDILESRFTRATATRTNIRSSITHYRAINAGLATLTEGGEFGDNKDDSEVSEEDIKARINPRLRQINQQGRSRKNGSRGEEFSPSQAI